MAFDAFQILTAGQLNSVARMDAIGLTNDVAAALSTFEQWGTEIVTFPDPGQAVIVAGLLTGSVRNNQATVSRRLLRTRVEISFDGGATWDQAGQTPNVEVSGGNQRSSGVATMYTRTGTPTGAVQIRAMLEQNVLGTAGDVEFQNGYLLGAMFLPST